MLDNTSLCQMFRNFFKRDQKKHTKFTELWGSKLHYKKYVDIFPVYVLPICMNNKLKLLLLQCEDFCIKL